MTPREDGFTGAPASLVKSGTALSGRGPTMIVFVTVRRSVSMTATASRPVLVLVPLTGRA